MTAPLSLVREAFEYAGEKHFPLALMLYPTVFGSEWRSAMLAFAYLKCLDDVVDEDPRPERALAALTRQRSLIDRAYRGRGAPAPQRRPERYGLPVFARDRGRGAALRPFFEAVLASMEFDTRRRGKRLRAAQLEAYVIELGSGVLQLFSELAAPGTILPPSLIREGSRAYLYADALIDLREDLTRGVVNVSKEDIARYALSDGCDDPRLAAWIAHRAPVVLRHFERALRHVQRVQPLRLRVFITLYLASKRRKLRRVLDTMPPAPPLRRRSGRRQ